MRSGVLQVHGRGESNSLGGVEFQGAAKKRSVQMALPESANGANGAPHNPSSIRLRSLSVHAHVVLAVPARGRIDGQSVGGFRFLFPGSP